MLDTEYDAGRLSEAARDEIAWNIAGQLREGRPCQVAFTPLNGCRYWAVFVPLESTTHVGDGLLEGTEKIAPSTQVVVALPNFRVSYQFWLGPGEGPFASYVHEKLFEKRGTFSDAVVLADLFDRIGKQWPR